MSVTIIAEAGVNHNGCIKTAKRLIDAAASAGADLIKFQTFRTELLVNREAEKADYQKQNTPGGDTQFDMLRRLEISPEDHYELIRHCENRNIRFFSTAFDNDSVDFLKDLNLGLWKIPSGEITNLPYLRKIARYGQPVLLSTGMCGLREVEEAVSVLLSEGLSRESITVLHCNTQYPTPMEDVHLRAMVQMGEHFGIKTGYSDHTEGIEVAIAAAALGAVVIEKHLTLDKTMEGPDHRASLEPEEFARMVQSIRNIERALGNGCKTPSPSEIPNRSVARKSIVAARPIRRGELFSEENLTVKRPGNGISPMRWNEIIGTAATRDYRPDEPIEP